MNNLESKGKSSKHSESKRKSMKNRRSVKQSEAKDDEDED